MKNKTKQKKKRLATSDAPITTPAPAIQPQSAASETTSIPLPALPPDTYLTLGELAGISGISYDVLVHEHNSGRLRVERTEGSGSTLTLFVHAYDAADYMCNYCPYENRWQPETLHPSDIEAGLQPRIKPHSKAAIAQLKEHLIKGGPILPILVMRVNGKIVRLDGEMRELSKREVESDHISVIFIPLPAQYAQAIAYEANRRHGDKLVDRDLVAKVCAYLGAEPGRQEDFLHGKISNKAVATATATSTATVTKARQFLQPPKQRLIDAVQTIRDLQPLFDKLRRKKPDWEAIVVVGTRVFTELRKQVPSKRARVVKQKLKVRAHPYFNAIRPSIRQLLDGRGGDQRI